MCKAVSILITKSKKVYWEAGLDSHDQLQAKFVKNDSELKDDKEPPENTLAKVEISPENGNYLKPNKWVFNLDERIKPFWWDNSYEKPCWKVLPLWKEKIYSQMNLKEALNPIHPFKIKCPKKITKRHITLLQKWASVRDSVRDSVWASVGASVRASVGASVWAYAGTFFPNIEKWEYCGKIKEKGYPFKSGVKLWKMGLVPAYDYNGKKWYLLGSLKGNGEIKIMWEGK